MSKSRTETTAIPPLRIGMIGLDTSHSTAFARLLNDASAPDHLPGAVITAAFPGGSPDMPEKSMNRVAGFAGEMVGKYHVVLCDTVEDVLARCDAVMIENVDGRQHPDVAKIVFPSRKPVFIDKPLAGTLGQGIEILRLAQQHRVPFFSASALRFAEGIVRILREKRALIRGAMTVSPCEIEPHHPDLFWYGVHGVEALYALLGPGCDFVTRVHTNDSDVVTGHWSDGRVGIFYGHRTQHRGFAYTAFLADGMTSEDLPVDYRPLVREVVGFFRTRQPPVSPREMIEVLAFMEAADESKRRGGIPVTLTEVLGAHDGVTSGFT